MANISGTGSVTAMGSTVRLNGNHTYGGTTISGGTLQLGVGNTDGSILGDITNNSILDFRLNGDNQTLDGNISGTGRVVKFGSRTLTLTGNNS